VLPTVPSVPTTICCDRRHNVYNSFAYIDCAGSSQRTERNNWFLNALRESIHLHIYILIHVTGNMNCRAVHTLLDRFGPVPGNLNLEHTLIFIKYEVSWRSCEIDRLIVNLDYCSCIALSDRCIGIAIAFINVIWENE
jgi:hypothetical protein